VLLKVTFAIGARARCGTSPVAGHRRRSPDVKRAKTTLPNPLVTEVSPHREVLWSGGLAGIAADDARWRGGIGEFPRGRWVDGPADDVAWSRRRTVKRFRVWLPDGTTVDDPQRLNAYPCCGSSTVGGWGWWIEMEVWATPDLRSLIEKEVWVAKHALQARDRALK
jgi:hypothetical protein